MTDEFSSYETGLADLERRLGGRHRRLKDLAPLQDQLLSNIERARQEDTEELRAERESTTIALNRLALSSLGLGFDRSGLTSQPSMALILVLNLVAAVALAVALGPPASTPCIPPPASALGRSVVLVLGFHLVWRLLATYLVDLRLSGSFGPISVATRNLFSLVDRVHPWTLPGPTLGAWLSVLALAAGILGLSPLSPFRVAESTPAINGFLVRYADGSTEILVPGSLVEITAHSQILVEAIIPDESDISCTWSTVSGTLLPAQGCATIYSPGLAGGRDALSVLAQSPCRTLQRFAGLHISVMEVQP